MRQLDSAIEMLVEQKWGEYARPRFAHGDRTVREAEARASFESHTLELFLTLQAMARRADKAVDYGLANVRLFVLSALEVPCEFCLRSYGLFTWAVSFRTSPRLGGPNRFLFSNLQASCALCATARGGLSTRVWVEVMAALNAENDQVAADWLDAVRVGQQVRAAGEEDPWVLPGPAGSQVTREAQRFGACKRKK